MRIEGPAPRREVNKSRKSSDGSGSTEVFSASSTEEHARAATSAPMQSATALEAMLALQSVDDPLLAKRRAVKHGSAMLDTLEDMKTDLLIGRVSEGRLNLMMALVSRARQAAQPELEALIADIELRVRVELAKLGKYAN